MEGDTPIELTNPEAGFTFQGFSVVPDEDGYWELYGEITNIGDEFLCGVTVEPTFHYADGSVLEDAFALVYGSVGRTDLRNVANCLAPCESGQFSVPSSRLPELASIELTVNPWYPAGLTDPDTTLALVEGSVSFQPDDDRPWGTVSATISNSGPEAAIFDLAVVYARDAAGEWYDWGYDSSFDLEGIAPGEDATLTFSLLGLPPSGDVPTLSIFLDWDDPDDR